VSRAPRRAGSPWRILVHSMEPKGMSGDSWHVASDRMFGGGGEDTSVEDRGRTYHQRHIELPGTDFDELVISRVLHVEQMDVGTWWLNVGGVVIHVTADRDGRPKHVLVEGPGVNDDPVEGCTYELSWGAE
jgi:hypothetical protein